MEELAISLLNVLITIIGFTAMMMVIGPLLGGVIFWFFFALLWYWTRLKKSHSKIAWVAHYVFSGLYLAVFAIYVWGLVDNFQGSFVVIIGNGLVILLAHWLAGKVWRRYFAK